jgi:hypothetical protein
MTEPLWWTFVYWWQQWQNCYDGRFANIDPWQKHNYGHFVSIDTLLIHMLGGLNKKISFKIDTDSKCKHHYFEQISTCRYQILICWVKYWHINTENQVCWEKSWLRSIPNINQSKSQLVSTCHDLSCLVLTCLDLSRLVSTCLDLSRLVSTVETSMPTILIWDNVRLGLNLSELAKKTNFPSNKCPRLKVFIKNSKCLNLVLVVN